MSASIVVGDAQAAAVGAEGSADQLAQLAAAVSAAVCGMRRRHLASTGISTAEELVSPAAAVRQSDKVSDADPDPSSVISQNSAPATAMMLSAASGILLSSHERRPGWLRG
jgi:hypothetical protein